jgi:hypothetical protein
MWDNHFVPQNPSDEPFDHLNDSGRCPPFAALAITVAGDCRVGWDGEKNHHCCNGHTSA